MMNAFVLDQDSSAEPGAGGLDMDHSRQRARQSYLEAMREAERTVLQHLLRRAVLSHSQQQFNRKRRAGRINSHR